MTGRTRWLLNHERAASKLCSADPRPRLAATLTENKGGGGGPQGQRQPTAHPFCALRRKESVPVYIQLQSEKRRCLCGAEGAAVKVRRPPVTAKTVLIEDGGFVVHIDIGG
ncbi:hypothetical protein L1987_37752 [Smallanthus sonchifolius]|uniref:Uncharacterized protein n=1 Tax=Smallanthus sonchifolius TaxID=185202 RepID=A0ACB9HHM7_9ASTR|nr:hypothetical protein L1987_37752 [Smallanthus sonchifolius]